MLEYCSVTYACLGRGFTQEIEWLRIRNEELIEWKGQYVTDFFNHMAQKQWELVTVSRVGVDFAVCASVAYFKRSI